MAKRKLNSWIGSFVEYTEKLPSPLLFRKWAAITAIAGALERRVYIRSTFGHTYPNMYTILVGPPGVGKSVITSIVYDLWLELGEIGHHLASTSTNKAAMIEDLREAERRLVDPTKIDAVQSYNSLKICANELSTLLPAYDSEFMGALTDIWDGKPYSIRRISRNAHYTIDRPQINMLSATTPSYLMSTLPEGAWDQGFLSRTMLVFSAETTVRPLFGNLERSEELYADLAHDMRILGEVSGIMDFTEEAAKVISDWHMEGGPPEPEHPRLMHYATRRTYHLLKLCIVAAASDNGGSMTITLDNVQSALDWLIETETYIPDIFKSVANGGDARNIEDCWHFIYQIYMKEGQKPVMEHRIVAFLQERVPAHSVMRVLEVMVRAKLIEKQANGYVPRKPKSR